MIVLLLFNFMFLLFLLLFIVVLESKVLSYFLLSGGVSRVLLFLSFFQCFIDFLKFLYKGLSFMFISNCSFSFLLINMFVFFCLGYQFLPFNVFWNYVLFSYLLYLFLEVFIMFWKLYLISLMSKNFQFQKLSYHKCVIMFMFMEGVSLFIYFIVFLFYIIFNKFDNFDILILNIKESELGGVWDYFCLFISLFFFFIVYISMKGFSFPFDYMEVESELVGGISIDMGGLEFSFMVLLEYINLILLSKLGVSWVVIFFSNKCFVLFNSILFCLMVFSVLVFSSLGSSYKIKSLSWGIGVMNVYVLFLFLMLLFQILYLFILYL